MLTLPERSTLDVTFLAHFHCCFSLVVGRHVAKQRSQTTNQTASITFAHTGRQGTVLFFVAGNIVWPCFFSHVHGIIGFATFVRRVAAQGRGVLAHVDVDAHPGFRDVHHIVLDFD